MKLKDIYCELEKLAPILWVPGNHEPGFYFKDGYNEEATPNSFNLHKKIKKLDEKLYVVGLGGCTPIITGKKWKHDHINFKELNLEKDFNILVIHIMLLQIVFVKVIKFLSRI